MITGQNQISFEEMMGIYTQLREDFREGQAKWLKFFPVINILHIINPIIIIAVAVLGYFTAKENLIDALSYFASIAAFVAVGFAGAFAFTLLWQIVFSFVRLGKRASLSKLKKKLEGTFAIKLSFASQMSLKPALAERDPHLIDAFSEKKTQWLDMEYSLYQGQIEYLKMQLKKMRSVEWQWMKYSLMFVAGIVATIIGVYLLVIAVMLVLVWAFLTNAWEGRNSTYVPSQHSEPTGTAFSGPSRHTLLLEDIEQFRYDLAKAQKSTEKMKDALLRWGVPNSYLFRNEELLIPQKQTRKVKKL